MTGEFMPVVFGGSAPGTVVALTDPGVQGILPAVGPLVSISPNTPSAVNFQAQKSIITRITLANHTNSQFLHTLGSDIYIYVFGDRIGQMTISGLSMAVNCNDVTVGANGINNNNDPQHGFEKMMAWYKKNKLSANPNPLTIMIGQTAIRGFVSDMEGDLFDPKLWMFQYNLSLFVLPD